MKRSHRPLVALASSVVVLGLFLAACGDGDSAGSGDPMGSMSEEPGGGDRGHDHRESSPVVEGARRIEVNATSFAFDPDEITVEVDEDVAIVLSSDDLLYDFVVDDDEVDVHVAAEKGETAEGGLKADVAGEYTFYCSVPGHREAGMEGTLIVNAA